MASAGRSLTELRGIDPYLEKLVLRWLDSPPDLLHFIEFGLAAAILARIPQDRVLNFMSCDQLLSWAVRLKGRVYDSYFAA
jgi:hypothetical protein